MAEQKRRSNREPKKTKDDTNAARKKRNGPGYMDKAISQPTGQARPHGPQGKKS